MTLTPTVFPSSGGASTFTTAFSENGTSLANWTQVSGAWSVAAGAFHVDTTGGTPARLKYNTSQQAALGEYFIFEADIQMVSAGIGADAPAGLLAYWPGAAAGAPAAELFKAGVGAGTKQVRAELDTTAAILTAFTPSPTWALDTFTHFTMVGCGSYMAILLANVVVATCAFSNTNPPNLSYTFAPFVGLMCNNAVCDFKNIRLSYLPLPT